MDALDPFNRLDFDDDALSYKQIQSVRAIDLTGSNRMFIFARFALFAVIS